MCNRQARIVLPACSFTSLGKTKKQIPTASPHRGELNVYIGRLSGSGGIGGGLVPLIQPTGLIDKCENKCVCNLCNPSNMTLKSLWPLSPSFFGIGGSVLSKKTAYRGILWFLLCLFVSVCFYELIVTWRGCGHFYKKGCGFGVRWWPTNQVWSGLSVLCCDSQSPIHFSQFLMNAHYIII